MLIKKLIQRLLDSRTTPSEAAHNASSIYTEPTWFNGWVFVACGNLIKSAILKNNRSGISVRLENGESDKSYLQWPHLILPCAKGDSWQVVISTKIGQTEGTTIRFIPSIGG